MCKDGSGSAIKVTRIRIPAFFVMLLLLKTKALGNYPDALSTIVLYIYRMLDCKFFIGAYKIDTPVFYSSSLLLFD
jgi:hypothetical protein